MSLSVMSLNQLPEMQPLQSLSYCNSSLKHIRICHKERFLNESQSQLDIKILLKYNYIQVLSPLILLCKFQPTLQPSFLQLDFSAGLAGMTTKCFSAQAGLTVQGQFEGQIVPHQLSVG